MRVIITGGTGLIGRSLIALLARQTRRSYEIVVLSRNAALATQQFERRKLAGVCVVGWDAQTERGWGQLIESESVLVNLAGASPAHWRWTLAYKERILASRLHAGEAVLRAIQRYGPPGVLLQASATGYYGNCGEAALTETSVPGAGFRATVCQQWEASTAEAEAQTRRCVLRTGIVLANDGGAFPALRRFAALWGSRLGAGRQWIPWIHQDDVASAILFLIEHGELAGVFNLSAPEPATNREFIRAAQHIMRRPAIFPLPAAALRLLLGEMATVVLDSQRVLPQRLLAGGFQFSYPRLEQALQQLIG